MRIILTILVIIFGTIYIPINMLYKAVQKWYLPMYKKDKVIYYAFAPFYWIFIAIVFILCWPYEIIAKLVAH